MTSNMPRKYKFSIVIPHFNQPELLQNCLTHLAKQTVPKENFEVIVIDDASKLTFDKNTITDFTELNIRILRQGKNMGPAVARNKGIVHALGEIICFTDADCEPESDWLKQIAISLELNDADYVGGATSYRHTGSRADFPYSDNPLSYYELKNGDTHFPGCNMAFKRRVFEKCMFDENFRFPWLEDSDLCWQAKSLGFKPIYNPHMFVIHPLRYNYFYRNLIKQKKFICVGYMRQKFPKEFDENFLGRFRRTNWTGETIYFFLGIAIILLWLMDYPWLAFLGIILGIKYIKRKILQIPEILRAIKNYRGRKNILFYLDLLLTYFFSPLISFVRSCYVFTGGIRYGQIIF